jgi:hypothetical protein
MQQHEGDDLLNEIRSYVTGQVPPSLVQLVTELTARTLVKIMTTPSFYLHLTYVQELNHAVATLQAQNAALLAQLTSRQTGQKVPRRPASPSPASRTAPRPKKPAPAPRKSPQPRSRNGQFKRGSSGR